MFVPPTFINVRVGIGTLKRVASQIEDLGNPQFRERFSSEVKSFCSLFVKNELPIFNPDINEQTVIIEVESAQELQPIDINIVMHGFRI